MNNKRQSNRLFTMLMLVMAIIMPYGGGHGHRRRLPKVMVKKTVLTSSPKLRSWCGSAIR